MIENPYPETWQDLQNGVCKILNEIGLSAEVCKLISTPRGNVEIDVYAVDGNSVDKIKYLVECKNWSVNIPQTVIHAFTTIMHETGGNIGYIISKKEMQAGAIEYTKNTNITGMSYEEFQRKYFSVWFDKWFVGRIGDTVDALTQYVEPFNSRRDRKVSQLSLSKQKQYSALVDKYFEFGISMAFFEFPRYSPKFKVSTPEGIEELKVKLSALGDEFIFNSLYFREFLGEIIAKVNEVTGQFHEVFNE